MKKILLMTLTAVLFAACSSEDESPKVPVTAEYDYSSAIGITYTQMLNTYGEPAMAFEGFYMYNISDGKTESLTLMANLENNKIYCAMQILAENAYTFENIYDYFAGKYTMYEYHEAGIINEDGEEYETEATAKFGNAEKEENATLIVELNGNSSISYIDPTNWPAEPESVSFANVAPENVPAMFLGRSWEDVEAEYGEAIQHFNGYTMISVSDNDYYTCIFFTIEEDIVTVVEILFDDLEDADVITYYEALGYTATDCGEVDGVHTYLFMNMQTMDMFTYSGGIARFVYVDPNADDDSDDQED